MRKLVFKTAALMLMWLVCSVPVRAAEAVAMPVGARLANIPPELLMDMVSWAVRLSGRQPPADGRMPDIMLISGEGLRATVCPEGGRNCNGLMAVYGTEQRHILLRDSLDMADPADQSFLVHELVHWLQHMDHGPAIEASCQAVLDAETEAYAVQNRYLRLFRQWMRVGEMLRFAHCEDGDGHRTAAAEPVIGLGSSVPEH